MTRIIEKIISIINWEKLSQTSSSTIEVMKVKHSEQRTLEIADLVEVNSTPNHSSNKTLKLLIKLANQVLLNDFGKLLIIVEKLGPVLNKSQNAKIMSYFRALCLLGGHFKLKAKEKNLMIKDARKAIASRLS